MDKGGVLVCATQGVRALQWNLGEISDLSTTVRPLQLTLSRKKGAIHRPWKAVSELGNFPHQSALWHWAGGTREQTLWLLSYGSDGILYGLEIQIFSQFLFTICHQQ